LDSTDGAGTGDERAPHRPVLLERAVGALALRADGTYVDATFGAGGHANAIAANLRGGRLVALDADPSVADRAAESPGVELVHASFADLASVLDGLGIDSVDGVLFDLGVSSMQLDRPERGFSLRADGPLDMRMDPARTRTAHDLLEQLDESALADILYGFGEERAARRIARAIVAARDAGRLPRRTLELARLVAGVVHVRGKRERIHPATRTFQALRIAVNDELGALERGLAAATLRTRPGGRIAVISFHSLEDRIVKRTFRDDPRLRALSKRPIEADAAELAANPRARSAKLRFAERLG
jgi:16S rRNA (cytosine1402-N4)-methyltransferase